jgi:pilus assembly protein CpaF
MFVDVFIQGETGGMRQERVDGGSQVTLGRHTDCTIVLDGDLVSRHHAALMFGLEAFRVEDTSSNGTLVGERMLRHEAVDVPYGTPLVLGNYTLQIYPALAGISVETSAVRPPTSSRPPPGSQPPPPPSPSRPAAAGGGRTTGAPSAPAALARTGLTPLPRPPAPPNAFPSTRPPNAPEGTLRDPGREANARGAAARPTGRAGSSSGETRPADLVDRLLADPAVTELQILDLATVFVERAGVLHRVDSQFKSEEDLRASLDPILTRGGRRLDPSLPVARLTLADGTRVTVVQGAATSRGPVVHVRKPSTAAIAMADLVSSGALPADGARLLERAIAGHRNAIVSGSPGAGKTTVLRAFASLFAPTERVVVVEDAPEIRPSLPGAASLVASEASGHGRRELLALGLSMRPDRLVLGACDGPEALDLVRALGGGVAGMMVAVTAFSAREALARLVSAARATDAAATRRELITHLRVGAQLLVHVSRGTDGVRRLTLSTPTGVDEDELVLTPVIEVVPSGASDARGKMEFRVVTEPTRAW